jgi:hypothetical protein
MNVFYKKSEIIFFSEILQLILKIILILMMKKLFKNYFYFRPFNKLRRKVNSLVGWSTSKDNITKNNSDNINIQNDKYEPLLKKLRVYYTNLLNNLVTICSGRL